MTPFEEECQEHGSYKSMALVLRKYAYDTK